MKFKTGEACNKLYFKATSSEVDCHNTSLPRHLHRRQIGSLDKNFVIALTSHLLQHTLSPYETSPKMPLDVQGVQKVLIESGKQLRSTQRDVMDHFEDVTEQFNDFQQGHASKSANNANMNDTMLAKALTRLDSVWTLLNTRVDLMAEYNIPLSKPPNLAEVLLVPCGYRRSTETAVVTTANAVQDADNPANMSGQTLFNIERIRLIGPLKLMLESQQCMMSEAATKRFYAYWTTKLCCDLTVPMLEEVSEKGEMSPEEVGKYVAGFEQMQEASESMGKEMGFADFEFRVLKLMAGMALLGMETPSRQTVLEEYPKARVAA